MRFFSDLASGFVYGLTGQQVAPSNQNVGACISDSNGNPISEAVLPPLYEQKVPWTRGSGVSLFNPDFAREPQQRSHDRLRAAGYSPFIATNDSGSKFIVWSTENSPNPPQVQQPQPQQERTLLQKLGGYFVDFTKFLISPITSIANFFCGDISSDTGKFCLGLSDVAVNAGLGLLCPPLFWGFLGAAVTGSLVENTFDLGQC